MKDPWFIRQAALAAMQGILANSLSPNEDKAAIAKEAVQAAEALEAELDAKYPLPEMPQPVAEPTQVIEPPPAESATVSTPDEAAGEASGTPDTEEDPQVAV